MEEVIKKFQDYLTHNHKILQEHLDGATKQNCGWEVRVIKQRINDLFLMRYRLEQLLSEAEYENLCIFAAFNKDTRKKLEAL